MLYVVLTILFFVRNSNNYCYLPDIARGCFYQNAYTLTSCRYGHKIFLLIFNLSIIWYILIQAFFSYSGWEWCLTSWTWFITQSHDFFFLVGAEQWERKIWFSTTIYQSLQVNNLLWKLSFVYCHMLHFKRACHVLKLTLMVSCWPFVCQMGEANYWLSVVWQLRWLALVSW